MQMQQRESHIKRFLSDQEKVDLCLNEVKQYGIILVGLNTSGKSIAAQQLCGRQIRNINQLQDINQPGQHRPSSMLPAFYQFDLSEDINYQRLVNVVDTIGYRQWACIYDTLIQGYSHFRLYSMFKNMKFIICFDSNYLHPIQVIQTLRQFVSYCKNPRQRIADIKKSCAFLFTNLKNCKCLDLVKIKNKVIQIRNQMGGHMDQIQIEAIRQLIDDVIENNRLYTMNHFDCQTVRQKSGSYRNLLTKIQNQIDSWWSRNLQEINYQQTLELIILPLAPKIIYLTTRYERFKRQYTQLIEFLNTKTNYIVQSPQGRLNQQIRSRKLFFVIGKLVYDAMGQPDACTFLDLIREEVQTQYIQNYDNQYRLLRQNKQRNLFGQQENQHQPQQNNSYLVRKFNALQNIESIRDEFASEYYPNLSFERIQTFQNRISSIIRQLIQLCRADNQVELVYKYGYMIYRWLQQLKLILTIQLCDPQYHSDSQRYYFSSKLKQASGHLSLDINTQFRDSMLSQYYYNQQCFRYQELVCKNLTYISHDHFQLRQMRFQLAIKSLEKQLNRINQLDFYERRQYLKILITLNSDAVQLYLSNQNGQQKECNLMFIRKIRKWLGLFLQKMKSYKLARKVYQSILFVSSVCKCFQTQITQLQNKNPIPTQQLLTLRLQFSKYTSDHFCQVQSIKANQLAFQLSDTLQNITQLKDKILQTFGQLRNYFLDHIQYERHLFEEKYFIPFDEELKNMLKELTEPNQIIE